MLLSNLLGPIKKPIFEILYRSTLRTFIQMEQTGIELRPFATRFLKMARAENLKIEVVDKDRNLYLVEKIAWLIVITPDQDLPAHLSLLIQSLPAGHGHRYLKENV